MRTFINIKPIDKIDKADLERLIYDEVYENQNIDYKSKLEFTTDGKNDLLSTVSALANTDGGDIIYGISEKRDVSGQPMGLPENIEGILIDNWDKTRLRIEQILNDYIQPHIQGIELKQVICDENKTVIIIKVPASILAPHMTFMDKCSRFYKRNSGGNQIMDYNEISNSFKQSINIIEKMDNYRRKRVEVVFFSAKEQPIVLDPTATIFVHYMPLFTEDYILDFSNTSIMEITKGLPLLTDRGHDFRLNYDGRLCFDEKSYAQIFRNGYIEFCDTSRLRPLPTINSFINNHLIIDLGAFENDIIRTTKKVVGLYGEMGINLPMVILVTIVGIKDYSIVNKGANLSYERRIDKAHLYFPKVIVESLDSDIEITLKPLFDILWNAAGIQCSLNYEQDGKRKV